MYVNAFFTVRYLSEILIKFKLNYESDKINKVKRKFHSFSISFPDAFYNWIWEWLLPF